MSNYMLTEHAVLDAQAKEKQYTLTDGNNLDLRILPSGRKIWLLRYAVNHKRHNLKLGEYPQMSLALARVERDKQQARIRRGDDIADERRLEKEKARPQATFNSVADEWLEHMRQKGHAENYIKAIICRLGYIRPYIGKMEIARIDRETLVKTVQKIITNGSRKSDIRESARRAAAIIYRVFEYAANVGKLPPNGAYVARNLRTIIASPVVQHFATTTAPADIRVILDVLSEYKGNTLQYCLKFIMLTACRSGEARRARWREIDFDNALWIVPRDHMKCRKEHISPLSRQALEMLKELQQKESSAPDDLIFPNQKGKEYSDAAFMKIIARMKAKGNFDLTVHGFRSMFSTIMNERGYNGDAIEMQLAHMNKDRTRAIYNRAQYIEPRRELVQAWAEYLNDIAKSKNVAAPITAQARQKKHVEAERQAPKGNIIDFYSIYNTLKAKTN